MLVSRWTRSERWGAGKPTVARLDALDKVLALTSGSTRGVRRYLPHSHTVVDGKIPPIEPQRAPPARRH